MNYVYSKRILRHLRVLKSARTAEAAMYVQFL